MTFRELISGVLQDIGKLGVGDYLDDTDAEYCRVRANAWMNALAVESLLCFCVLRTEVPLASGTPTYTIGTGGVINIPRPVRIEKAGLIVNTSATPPLEVEIDVITDQRWQLTPMKTLTGPLAQGVYYDKSFTAAGRGLIYPHPIPTTATTKLVLYTEQKFSSFATLDTDYTFPDGYELFFRTNIAGEVAPGFGKTLTDEQKKMATRARAMVKRANIKIVESTINPRTPGINDYGGRSVRGGGYNIRTDE